MLLGLLLCLAQAPPDIVVVVGDDIARSDLAVVDTPSLDFVRDIGVSFTRAYSHPLCSPTRRSLLFGRWPGQHTQQTCGQPGRFSPEHTEFSLGKLMKGAGYNTGAFGKWHVGSNSVAPWELTPQLHGFDVWRAGLPANVVNCGGSDYERWLRVDDGFSRISREYQTDAVRDEFRDWWVSTPSPRFAYVAYQAAHSPFHVPPSMGVPGPIKFTDRKMYEFMVTSLDDAIGEMLAVIDVETTVFLFVGDNGTPSPAVRANQDPDKVKKTTFEDGVNVPLLVSGPGVFRGGTSSALVHTVDFVATLAEFARQRVPPQLRLDSRSFRRVLESPAEAVLRRPFVYCENSTPGLPHDRAVITRRFKLRNVDGVEELYDLEEDPRERRPLDLTDPAHDRLLRRMRVVLEDPSHPRRALEVR